MAVSPRPRTPSRSGNTPSFQSPPVPNDEKGPQQQGQRRSSFGFLRRGKSVERLNSKRSVSGGKLKKHSKLETAETSGIPERAPKIPDLATHARLSTFGGDGAGDSNSKIPHKFHNQVQSMPARSSPYNVPIPQVPSSPTTADIDPYARTESMKNRGRYSYASSAVSTLNSPRRVRRRKDPTPFNVLVIGARNSGKTSFIDFLQSSLTLPPRKQRPHQHDDDLDMPARNDFSPKFVSHYLETEMEGERIGLTVWDSEGFEKNMVDLQLREIVRFIESRFEDTLSEEVKVVRSPGTKDPHIHCVILLLDPVNLNHTLSAARKAREGYDGNFSNGKSYLRDTSPETLNGLDENLDLQVLRSLQGKTTVVPVISKADTVTIDHMQSLKRAVWRSLKEAKFDPFESLGLEEDDGDDEDEDADSEAIEDEDEGENNDLNATPRGKKGKHSRHDSKRFNETDEDEYTQRQNANLLRPDISHLDSASSSSGSSFNVTKPLQQSQNAENLPSQNLPQSASANSSSPTPHIPYSIITPDQLVTPHQPIPGQIGRRFAWGFADPYNAAHCDFLRFRDAVFKEWFTELREASREMWYEEWRAQRLNKPVIKAFSPNRSIVDSRTSNATRQGMVPVGMMGNNVPNPTSTATHSMVPRIPGGASSARASPNPQTMMIPVATDDGEVGVAR